jgi:hypothetical protein
VWFIPTRKQLAAQFPLLFSPQKSQRFQEDRIAPTTKYALSQMGHISNKEVDDENMNWVQCNIATPTSSKGSLSKPVSSKKKKAENNRNSQRSVLTQSSPAQSTPRSASKTAKPSVKICPASIREGARTPKAKRTGKISKTHGDCDSKNGKQSDSVMIGHPSVPKVGRVVELPDIYVQADAQDSMIVNFDLEDRLWTPMPPKISNINTESLDNSSGDTVELQDIYVDNETEIGMCEGINLPIAPTGHNDTDQFIPPEMIASDGNATFDEIYGETECNDSMFVNFAVGDIAKTPYIPTLKSLLRSSCNHDTESSLLAVGSSPASGENESFGEDNLSCRNDNFDPDEICSKTILRRSLVLASLKNFISSMIGADEFPINSGSVGAESVSPMQVSTPDLLEGKTRSRESLETFWESACRDPQVELTPVKVSDQPSNVSIPGASLGEVVQVDQYSLNSTAKFTVNSVTDDIRYDHAKYVISAKVTTNNFIVTS